MQNKYLIKVLEIRHIQHQEIVHSSAGHTLPGVTHLELPHPSSTHGITQKKPNLEKPLAHYILQSNNNKKEKNPNQSKGKKKALPITVYFALTSMSNHPL